MAAVEPPCFTVVATQLVFTNGNKAADDWKNF